MTPLSNKYISFQLEKENYNVNRLKKTPSNKKNYFIRDISNIPTTQTNKKNENVIHLSVKNEKLINKVMNEVFIIAKDPEMIEKIYKTLNETNKDLPKVKHLEVGLTMTLYRGCKADQFAKMLINGSAGGEPANEYTEKPTEQAAINQVGEKESIPEFTSNYEIAKSFGRGHIVVAMSMNKKHLYQGSVTESGMVCNLDAPIKLLAWRPGPPFQCLDTQEDKENI